MQKRSYLLLTIAGMLLLTAGLVVWAGTAPRALAQCGDTIDKSSCITCHEVSDPVTGTGEWHDVHAAKDCCWNCHGGNTTTMDKDLAHAGMTLNPLVDTYQDCHACHPDDYQSRAERFGASLGIVPVDNAPNLPTPQPISLRSENQLVILPTSEPAQSASVQWYPELILLSCALLSLVVMVILSRMQANKTGMR